MLFLKALNVLYVYDCLDQRLIGCAFEFFTINSYFYFAKSYVIVFNVTFL